MKMRRILHTVLATTLAIGLTACAANKAFKSGNQEAKQGNWDAAVVHYTRATREDPDNIEYRMALQRALAESAGEHLQEARKRLAAENLEGAIEEFELSTQLDPTNRYAADELAAARAELKKREERKQEAAGFEQRRARARDLLSTRPVLEPSSMAPINLKFAQDTSLQKIFEVLSKLSGINVLFDESFRDKRVTIDLVDVSFKEALDKLVLINRLFYQVVDPSTIIIVPDNAQKHRQYDDLVLKTFYIVNAEVNTIANMLRTIAGIQRVQPNPELKSVTVRATPDQVAVADRIVELNDKTKSEVILDIEMLEVNRAKVLEYGLELAEYQVGLSFDPAGRDTESGAFRLNRLVATDTSDFLITFPSAAIYRLFKSIGEVRVLSQPRLRASEGQAAVLRIGQEIPIPVTSFVSQFQPGALPTTPVTSFQYRNVGINITITPKVFVDGEIELQLDLEASTQLETRVIGGIELPVFGTRNVTNVIRLRDGETNLIGGLINVLARQSVSGIPGIVDLPILNKLFANNDQERQDQEVVFSVTPHIVRAPMVLEEDLIPLPMGTEQRIRVPSASPPLFIPPAEELPEVEAAAAPTTEPPSEPVESEPTVSEEPDTVPEEVPTPPGQGPEGGEPEAPAEPEVPAEPEPAEPEPAAEPSPPPVGPVSVLLSPPASTVSVGQRVEMALIAGGADGLSSGDIEITFDATMLEAVEVQPGPFLTIDGKRVTFAPIIEAGRIRVSFSREEDTVGLRGSGHLLRVVFETLAAGRSEVNPTGALKDASGEAIQASFASARIEAR
jgi:general secretion pathway protein D